MKPYKVEIEVTNKYSMEIHAIDETEAAQKAENLEPRAIETGGDFEEITKIEVTDIERMEREDDES